MFDELHKAYGQMQPGDKMVMHLHKSPKPPSAQYQTPGAPMDAPVGAPMGGPSSVPGIAGGEASGGVVAKPPMNVPGTPGFSPTDQPLYLPSTGAPPPFIAPDSPLASRQALIQALASRFGGQA